MKTDTHCYLYPLPQNKSSNITRETLTTSCILDLLTDLIQNATIEERVALLEIQVVEIQDDVTGLEVDLTELEGYVDFLFDETVIQDERLLNLEQETEEIDEQLVVIDDNVDSKFVKLIGFFVKEHIIALLVTNLQDTTLALDFRL